MSDPDPQSGPKEACKTFIEQTKLLVTLASAFVVAPAAVIPLFISKDHIPVAAVLVRPFLCAEISFVFSVLAGYVVLATIAGYQHQGLFNVHRPATRISSLVQIILYLVGLWEFIWFLRLMLRQSS